MTIRCQVGYPDAISFLCLFSVGLVGIIVPTLQYISIATDEFGANNISVIIDCYSKKGADSNKTCHDISTAVEDKLAVLNIKINIVQGVLAPFFVFALGGFSDIAGKKFAVIFILSVSIVRCIALTINALFMDKFPPDFYIVVSGFLLGIGGGSIMAINNFLIGYLSVTTLSHKQTSRFSLLIGVGLIGFILGPLIAGLILQFTSAYFIIGLISIVLLTIALCLTVFCLKPQDKTSEIEQRFMNISGFKKKFASAMRFQYQNTINLFKYQSYLGKFIGANLMFMLTSVGLASPLVIVSTVYVLGEPFKWSSKARGYFGAGLGFTLAAQSVITIRILRMFKLSRPAIIRLGIFVGFVGTFFLALATTNSMLILGVGLSSFVIIASPTTQSIILSLVEVEQIGTAVGVMAAVNAFAECCLINVILVVYQKTRHMMKGFCFFTLSFLLGIDLVIAMFYRHPQTTREDRSILTYSDDDILNSPVYPSSDVLKGGVPKTPTTPSQEFPFPTIDQQYAATDNQYAATDNQYGATDNDGIAPG